ncbi:MAG: TMEM165/GDT1 family protein [Nostoc sp. DedQUE08]|uniref:TMEM165/GDT1 family protein n=1 Tax=unclassified Nostoc TaxID=2593658 RepID=UPI002AD435F2|nr:MULTISPECIES: TMEM165/GDT1 family protein [unclassified Nostoc]MDZ8031383.1 TMEM165/GDT1 family protein [Nostoc sp. DedSLP04]MDZ8066808.1 TMEM165/GDT1 family protein [Nostoc sp. DedQUE08]MDZ8094777.1 TMEM165/GDT1 family protein [Nostoc sp. DedQUE05]MDZ8130092.1 TMEM165/GDT1 family protein [Nostoc sp. DedQUE07]
MKLDSAPLEISGISHTEIELELEDSNDFNLTPAIAPLVQPVIADSPQKQQSTLVIFGTTFVTIFLAEIGDKTQLSTLLMSAQSHSPWVVFIGSAAALITTSLLGVLLGSWIANRLSPKTVEKSAGVMLLVISLMLFWDVFTSY